MMRNPQQTIGNFIDKQNVSFIASISVKGFPNRKAMLLPRKRVGINVSMNKCFRMISLDRYCMNTRNMISDLTRKQRDKVCQTKHIEFKGYK